MHINSQYPGTDLFFDHTDWRDAIARMSDYASRRFSDQDSYYRDLNQSNTMHWRQTNTRREASIEDSSSDYEAKTPQRRAIACKACARAKTKCDKTIPSCSRCIAKGLICEARCTKRASDAATRIARKQFSLYRRPVPIVAANQRMPASAPATTTTFTPGQQDTPNPWNCYPATLWHYNPISPIVYPDTPSNTITQAGFQTGRPDISASLGSVSTNLDFSYPQASPAYSQSSPAYSPPVLFVSGPVQSVDYPSPALAYDSTPTVSTYGFDTSGMTSQSFEAQMCCTEPALTFDGASEQSFTVETPDSLVAYPSPLLPTASWLGGQEPYR